ncbi:MAG TPA: TauD/TfdA family dioxygenase, partial [Candidatus Methylomirabilis sp.]|nr:TauD/TfdA family dioxygenase [Candidatus Methylomirabilis sp.]
MTQIAMTPTTGPKAWRGDALAGDRSWIVSLTDAEVADLDRALATARASGRALEDIQREHFPLTVLRPKLEQTLGELMDGRGFVVIRGVPVARHRDEDVGLMFWGMGRYLGSPLYQNPQGELLGHVFDHGRTYGNIDVRGYETNAYLPYHT